MEEQRMKMEIEVLQVGDGRTFLNFWNYQNGDDVVAELKDGKLFQDDKEITLQKFIEDVKDRVSKF